MSTSSKKCELEVVKIRNMVKNGHLAKSMSGAQPHNHNHNHNHTTTTKSPQPNFESNT